MFNFKINYRKKQIGTDIALKYIVKKVKNFPSSPRSEGK